MKTKLFLLAAIGIAMAVMTGGTGVLGLRRAGETAQRMTEQHVAMAQAAQSLNDAGLHLRRFEKDLFLNIADPKKVAEYAEKWEAKTQQTAALIDTLDRLAEADDDRDEIREVRRLVDVYVTAMRDVRAQIAAGALTLPADGNRAITPFKDAIRSLEQHADAIVKRANARLAAAQVAQDAEARRQLAWLLGMALLAISAGLVLAWRTSRSITVPLSHTVSVLEAVARGDLDRKVGLERADEVGRMAAALDVAIDRLREDRDKIREQNEAMRRVLDQVKDGLVHIDREGRVGSECSAAATALFGAVTPGTPFDAWIEGVAPTYAVNFRVGWDELIQDVMPRELLIHQLPRQFTVEDRHFQVRYGIHETPEGTVSGALITVSDITEQLSRERLEREQMEMVALFQRVTEDRGGALAFAEELAKLGDAAVACADLTTLQRLLHTLKGNLALYGAASASTYCHQLEDVLADAGELTTDDRAGLKTRVDVTVAKVRALAREEHQNKMSVSDEDLQRLLRLTTTHATHAVIAAELMRLRHEPAARLLGRAAESARQLAGRTGTKKVEIEIVDHGVRLDGERWRPFFASLVHVGRNAIDHGVETTPERVAASKAPAAKIVFEVIEGSGDLCVKVADDGRGIAWDKIGAAASRSGRPATSSDELVDALFSDGVSSRDAVDEVSGRGVGLAAVRGECERLGGRVDVRSTLGAGTTFEFHFPLAS